VKQDSLKLAHKCGLTFGNRKAPKYPILSMKYPQIGLYIPVTSKIDGTTKHLQKSAFVQAGIHMKPLRPMPAARTSNQMLFFNSLGSTSFYTAMLTNLKKMILLACPCLNLSRGFQDTTINQVWLSSSNSMWHPQVERRHGKVLGKIMAEVRTFLKGQIFDQVVLHAVTNDSNNQILLSYAVVTSEIEDKWVWLTHQLEQDLPGSSDLVADYTKRIENQQFQGCIRKSGF
jgi:hypothetical protein